MEGWLLVAMAKVMAMVQRPPGLSWGTGERQGGGGGRLSIGTSSSRKFHNFSQGVRITRNIATPLGPS